MINLADYSSTAETSVTPDFDADWHEAAPWACSYRNAIALTAGPERLVWGRIVALALALTLHIGLLLYLTLPPPAWSPATTRGVHGPVAVEIRSGERLQVVFVAPSADSEVGVVAGEQILVPRSPAPTPNSHHGLPVAPPPSSSMPAAAEPVTAAVPSAAMPNPPVPADPRISTALPSATNAAVPAARLFHADGSVALPANAIADLRAVESDARKFDYMTPGLATAELAFHRQSTVPYTPTRFDADWKPVRTLGDDIVIPISEMLTYENERKTFRCSLLPPVCTWGRVDAAVELDDPNTLNPIEDAECRALWDTIIAATNQSKWLGLRKRYDAQCRKPLERELVPAHGATARSVSVR